MADQIRIDVLLEKIAFNRVSLLHPPHIPLFSAQNPSVFNASGAANCGGCYRDIPLIKINLGALLLQGLRGSNVLRAGLTCERPGDMTWEAY